MYFFVTYEYEYEYEFTNTNTNNFILDKSIQIEVTTICIHIY